MRLLVLSAADVAAALPMGAAIDAMRGAFIALSDGSAAAPPRVGVPVEARRGVTLLMGALVPAQGLVTKIVSVFPDNARLGKRLTNGVVLVLDPDTGEPRAVCDGASLTALRTGAASGLATALLARADARVGAVIGCGAQARTQLVAIDAVRKLDAVHVAGRRPDAVASFIREMQGQVSARLAPAASADAAVAEADVVCTATSSRTPVFDGERVRPGTHVNGVGSFTRDMQEVDAALVCRARVYVDSRAAALEEAGDLILAAARGATRPEEWRELGELAAGRAAGRSDPGEITFFKSVGHAVQDVAAAVVAVEAARRAGLGQTVEL